MTLWLTRVGGEQGAALAVDDLFDNRHILGERCRHDTEAGHHGVHGGNSSHHTEVGVKIWRKERNMNEMGKKQHPHSIIQTQICFQHQTLWSGIT